MKTQKYHHAINCKCHKTGVEGNFIIDKDYFKINGEYASLNNLVFDNLIDLFRYANTNELKTGKILDENLPTYFVDENEIIKVINSGINVYWTNTAYNVIVDNGKLYSIYKYNSSMCQLQPSEHKDCFIGA